MVASTQYDSNYIPVRGDVIDINFDPQAGKEIWDWRPALVLSSWNFNRYSSNYMGELVSSRKHF
ncbi:hypothetical protein C6503_12820 [Candidatus Poribacteria bacterium]|nr:MAG: hypothetical protein C6503_12820 [Candidatus Poribacteria bacterium]